MRFSIVIPVYNMACYLKACLDSVFAQDYDNFEVLCVDDGSTDDSCLILDEYQRHHSRLKVIHQTNAGVSAARNIGLESTQGEWVWFVDSDDLIHPHALSWFEGVIVRNPAAETICTTKFLQGECAPHEWPDIPGAEAEYFSTKIEGRILKAHRRVVCGALVRRTCVKDTRFSPYVMGEDMLFLAEVFWKTKAWVVAPVTLYFYRKHQGSTISLTPSRRGVKDALETERKILELIGAHRSRWSEGDLDEYFLFVRQFAWTTFGGMYFRLPADDRELLLDSWISLQEALQRVYRENLYRRLVLSLVRLIHSSFLCKMLVFGPRLLGVKA